MINSSPAKNANDIPLNEFYIELLKKALTHTLWRESTRPIDPTRLGRGLFKFVVCSVIKFFSLFKLRLSLESPHSDEAKLEGRTWPEFAHTMIGMLRLNNLQQCIETVLKDKVPGDMVETGVWRGGASILMRGILKAYDVRDRKVWVADSFEGLPLPDADKYPADQGSTWHEPTFLAVSLEQVKSHFEVYGLLDSQVEFLKGWFKDTLPHAPIRNIAVLRLDGDMYQSTMESLESLYSKVSPGGFIIIDDYYAVKECQKAVDDFRSKMKIADEIKRTDWAEVYWRKSK
jgi:O-methyltransferase